MNNKEFLNADDVATIMSISMSMAYRIIQTLNGELQKDGYLTVRGKVSRKYFEYKMLCSLN